MNRKQITSLLTDTLINTRLSDRKYYAREVTLDYGTAHPKRVDVMEFKPGGVVYASDIEKGTFVCYEIKSCKEDVYSGNGLRFYGEENYIVTTMACYKDIQGDIREGKLHKYIEDNYPESSLDYGVMVLVPEHINVKSSDEVFKEYEKPTLLSSSCSWKLYKILPCRPGLRARSMNELLFCMLRAKHSYTNN